MLRPHTAPENGGTYMALATLIDVNNVRGTMQFPELSSFCSAICQWARAHRGGAVLQLLAVDHGVRAESLAVDDALVVSFAGERTDADTVIVHAVDWILATQQATKVLVISSDHLLRQRCSHELPTGDGGPFGAKRPREQLRRLSFEGSSAFGQCLDVGAFGAEGHRSLSPCDVFAAKPPSGAGAGGNKENGSASGPQSRRARRKAEQRAEVRRLGSSNERTAARVKAAAELHARVETRVAEQAERGDGDRRSSAPWYSLSSIGGVAASGSNNGTGIAAEFVQWFSRSCIVARPSYLPELSVAADAAQQPPRQGNNGGSDGGSGGGSGGGKEGSTGENRKQSPSLDSMCCYSRLKPGTSYAMLLALAAYAPLGSALVALRLLALAFVALLCALISAADRALVPAILPETAIEAAYTAALRLLCFSLGFVVRLRSSSQTRYDGTHDGTQCAAHAKDHLADGGAAKALARAAVVVSNHVSQWDGLPIRLLTPCATVVRETYTRDGAAGTAWARMLTRALIAPIVAAAFAPIAVPTPSGGGVSTDAASAAARERASVKAAMRAHAANALRTRQANERSSRAAGRRGGARGGGGDGRGGAPSGRGGSSTIRPLLVFPEGSITNGRMGTMRFAQSAFALDAPVLPVAIKLNTPLPVEADTVWSPLASNVLWTLFQPWHAFVVTVLPEVGPTTTTSRSRGAAGGAPKSADGVAASVAHEVASRIAAELGIACTDWSTSDKAERSKLAKQVGKAAWLLQQRAGLSCEGTPGGSGCDTPPLS